MTVEEVSKKYDYTVSTIQKQWSRTQQSIYKKTGDFLVKNGRGEKTIYKVEPKDCRALTLFDETKDNILLDTEDIHLANFDFIVFLAIVATPQLVFRGSYFDFLDYVMVKRTSANLKALKDTLQSLTDRDLVSYVIDKTNSNWFVAAIYRSVETELSVGIKMVQMCKRIAEEHNKRNWVPLLKTWIGIQQLAENQPYTMSQLSNYTGLSEYQLRECKKILEKEEIFKTSKAYLSFCYCLGTKVELNAFYN